MSPPMVRTTDAGTTSAAAGFYDRLAPDYDAMTDFERRFVIESPFFRLLVGRYDIRTAVDAGCGTGFHALLLAGLGVHMTAVDISSEMLSLAAKHARERQLRIRTLHSTFEALPASCPEPTDAVFCLGNTMAHADSTERRRSWIRAFRETIRPGGTLIIQILNYDRILARRERIQGIREAGAQTFVRFYDFRDPDIVFSILSLDRNTTPAQGRIDSVVLHPALSAELVSDLEAEGFVDPHLYGSIALESFDAATSRDIVVIASRSAQESPAGRSYETETRTTI